MQFEKEGEKERQRIAICYTYPQLPIQKEATGPGSIFNQQGGSIFNRRQHLHDSCRENDGHDPFHGSRAVDFAGELRGRLFDIDDAGFALLEEACSKHSDGHMEAHPAVQACWDADRLDLWRVWITPDPRRLATQAARSRHVYDSAKRRALFWRE